MTIPAVLVTVVALPAHQQRFLVQVMPLWEAIPGRPNALSVSRQSGWNNPTFRRWFERCLPWDTLHWELVTVLVRVGARAAICPRTRCECRPEIRHHDPWSGRSLERSGIALPSWIGQRGFPSGVRQTHPRGDQADRVKTSLRSPRCSANAVGG